MQVLSLQLLKILLENSGSVFRNSERFQGAIKQHLCLSLLKNVTVPSAQVQSTSSGTQCHLTTGVEGIRPYVCAKSV